MQNVAKLYFLNWNKNLENFYANTALKKYNCIPSNN